MTRLVEGHFARKRFGQNFLVDNSVIDRIVRAVAPKPDDTVIEIGPGLGALTTELLRAHGRLTVVELDRDLAARLPDTCKGLGTLTLHQADALRFDFRTLQEDGKPLRVVGNLPYNISTPLIFHLLEHANIIHDMHFMLQKEVVERMAAAPGNGDFGRLTVMLQYRCRVEPLFPVPAGAFRPAPKVESAVVRLVPHTTLPYPAQDEALFARLVSTAFTLRRKTLRNTLKTLGLPIPDQLPVDLSLRPEDLAVHDFVALSNALAESRT